jgi:hypothetical protein
VAGLLQSIDQEYLSLEIDGKPRRIRRSLVVGVILGPVASRVVESDVPAVVDLAQGDQIPAFLREIRGEAPARKVAIRFRGSRTEEVEEIPEGWIRRIRFSSDRVVFLSDIQPVMVDEAPLLGTRTTFPWRRDLAASGSPLRLGGRSYRKGIGVHSRSVLEFDLGARFRSLAGTLGLDESAGAEAGVSFRVFADGKELYSKGFRAGDPAGNLSLPVDGVNRLRLEVDYGDDGVDFGDHADWADLRVTR